MPTVWASSSWSSVSAYESAGPTRRLSSEDSAGRGGAAEATEVTSTSRPTSIGANQPAMVGRPGDA